MPSAETYALLVGITRYSDVALEPLPSAKFDVEQLAIELETHRDGTLNFHVEPIIVEEPKDFRAADLLAAINDGLDGSAHFVFYFSGHGHINDYGLQLATPEKDNDLDSGVYFDTLLHRFNEAEGTEITVILDCCRAGAAGDISVGATRQALKITHLREGVTILASSARAQDSFALPDEPSDFTKEVLACLRSDLQPTVDIVDVYTWSRRKLLDQTPVLRTFGSNFSPLRAASLEVARASNVG